MSLTRRIKSVATVLGLRVLGRHYGGAFSLYLDQQHPTHQDYGELESIFETSTGLSIPIYANYRFQVKAGWQYYGSLQIMGQLKRAGQLTKAELDFFPCGNWFENNQHFNRCCKRSCASHRPALTGPIYFGIDERSRIPITADD